MAVRSGMTNLISRWRALVNDGSANAFDDERAQQILDARRFDFYQEPLTVQPVQVGSGTVQYRVYTSRYQNLEGTASGTDAFRLYDSLGSAVSGTATYDLLLGRFTFTSDQRGSARYLDGRSFDLNGAAADAWRERAGQVSGNYDFRVEGRQFTRSQWFAHCMQMASHYDSRAEVRQVDIVRNDQC